MCQECNYTIVCLDTPLGRKCFSCEDRSVDKQCGLIGWFLYDAPYSTEGFLKNLSDSFINNLCVEIRNSSNTLQFFYIPPNNVNRILWKNLQFCFLTLSLFSL